MSQNRLFSFTEPLKDLRLGKPSNLYSEKIHLNFNGARNGFEILLQKFCNVTAKPFLALSNFKRIFF